MEQISSGDYNEIRAILGILSDRHSDTSPRVANARRRARMMLKRLDRKQARRHKRRKEAKRTIVSQRKAILEYLLTGRSITPRQARELCGCERLGARIYEIRHRLGYKVKMKMVENPQGNSCGCYWIENEMEG